MYDNVYDNPAKHGLELVNVVDLSEPDYSFDLLAIWKGPEGYYLGTDSGCSCPMPFENFNGVEDLTGPLTAKDAREEAQSLWDNSYGKYQPEEFARALSMVV